MIFCQENQIYFQEFTDFLIEICTATCLSGSGTYDYAAACFDNWCRLHLRYLLPFIWLVEAVISVQFA